MKLVLIGNLRPAHSTENHWRRSFEALGHDVCCVQEDTIASMPELRRQVICEQPDALMYVRTWGLGDEALSLWRECAERGIVTFAAHLDRFFGLDRADIVQTDPMFRVAHVFTADGDYDDAFDQAGVNHHWLPPAVVHDECYDADRNPEWLGRWDVAFVGSAPTLRGGNYHPEWPHRAQLVEKLREWYGPRFVHVGNGGDLGNNHDEPNLRGDRVNQFYASVPVIVGDSCLTHAHSRYWSDRVPETWGRGGFLIHPRVDALEAQIGPYPGSQWDPYDWDYLKRDVDGWLADPELRVKVRNRISTVIRTEHTYRHRAQEMFTTMGLPAVHYEAAQ